MATSTICNTSTFTHFMGKNAKVWSSWANSSRIAQKSFEIRCDFGTKWCGFGGQMNVCMCKLYAVCSRTAKRNMWKSWSPLWPYLINKIEIRFAKCESKRKITVIFQHIFSLHPLFGYHLPRAMKLQRQNKREENRRYYVCVCECVCIYLLIFSIFSHSFWFCLENHSLNVTSLK